MEVQEIKVRRDGSFAIPAEGFRITAVLTADQEKIYDVPQGAKTVFFGYTGDFYAAYTLAGGADAHASVPVTDIINGNGLDISPNSRDLMGTSKISLIAEADCKVTMTFCS